MKKVALIGGLGKIGQVLIKSLSDSYRFTIIDSASSDSLPVIHANVSDCQSLLNAIPKDTDIIFDLTATHIYEQINGWEDFEILKQTHIQGIYNILEAAKILGIKKVIYSSTVHVNGLAEKDGLSVTGKKINIYDYPKPDMIYGAMKLFGESIVRLYARHYQIKTLCLRFGFVGNNNTFFNNLRLSRIILYYEDLTKIVKAAFESNLEYGVYHAVSENANHPFDLRPLRNDLGLKRSDFIVKNNSSVYHKFYMRMHGFLLKKQQLEQ